MIDPIEPLCICYTTQDAFVQEKFKDVILVQGGFYYTVYVKYCKNCGAVHDGGTWVE